jgi:multiple sugar transport system substrate-binding protein
MAGKGFLILQAKRHNISPFGQSAGKAINDPVIVDYTEAVRRYPVTASPYYSSLPSNTIEFLHGLMQDVLLHRITPEEAAERLDESVKNEAKMHYK